MKKIERDLKHLHEIDKVVEDLTLFETNLNPDDLKYLESKELIKTIYFHDGNYEIRFTNKGLTYFEDKKELFLNKLIWNVITPICLSIATTLITLWIKSLFE